ncbi:MAG: L,D-transpeptidase family protein [Proteobacteria bacterium]|nr:L,D-transpeptidase family protein [Pseudomonadota bacterium]
MMHRQILSGFILAFGLIANFRAAHAEDQKAQIEAISARAQQEMVFLLVDKAKLQADLLTWPEDIKQAERLISFKIAIGKSEGDKQKAGDNKTPEGIYFTQHIIDGKGLPAKYGPTAIPIDFPNPLDRFLGKTGYGIWLHGVEQDHRIDAAKVTEGCVAFYNADIQSLTQWLVPNQSVVVIARDAAQVNRPEDVEKVRTLTKQWIDDWANRDIEHYIKLYHPDFKALGKNRQQYYSYKKKIFASYEKMSLSMSNIRVFTHDRYAVAVMNQDFNGDDRYRSYGRKLLYWHHTDAGEWKLFHEDFDKQPMLFLSVSREKIAQIIKNSPSTKALQETIESRL